MGVCIGWVMFRITDEQLEQMSTGAPPDNKDYDEVLTPMAKELLASRAVVSAARQCFNEEGWPKIPITAVRSNGYYSANKLVEKLKEALKKLEEAIEPDA